MKHAPPDPLPEVHDVYETAHQDGHFTIIARDPNSGHRSYSVIRIHYEGWEVELLGRELPLNYARKLARA